MNNAVYKIDIPANEPILGYLKGSKEEKALAAELQRQSETVIEIPLIIDGKEVKTGKIGEFRMPCDHKHVLARYHMAGEKEVKMAIDAACKAQQTWCNVPWQDRAAVALKIARLIADKYRAVMNAATMLGQGKNIFQAEIDSACETIDFLRFNASFMSQIYSEQPVSDATQMNRLEYRALEGFVFAVSPFNFTAIASNLSMSPVIMGNAVVWKPATTAILSNYYLMQIYKEAGLPDGVINFLPGQGSLIGNVVFADPRLAGIHFTGSSSTFNSLWLEVAKNLANYRSYPKIVGETGGKDFIVVHESADIDTAATGILRGSFEYQGQKCSACSRVYAPASKWPAIKNKILNMLSEIKMGDVRDYNNFVNAVIDEKSFDSIMAYIEKAKADKAAKIVAGGKGSKEKGYSSNRPSSKPLTRTSSPCAKKSSARSLPFMSMKTQSSKKPSNSVTALPPTLSPAPSSPVTAWRFSKRPTCCAMLPATSISTTSAPALWSVCSPSAAAVVPAPTTRPAPC